VRGRSAALVADSALHSRLNSLLAAGGIDGWFRSETCRTMVTSARQVRITPDIYRKCPRERRSGMTGISGQGTSDKVVEE
jgi:hypothetical protein